MYVCNVMCLIPNFHSTLSISKVPKNVGNVYPVSFHRVLASVCGGLENAQLTLAWYNNQGYMIADYRPQTTGGNGPVMSDLRMHSCGVLRSPSVHVVHASIHTYLTSNIQWRRAILLLL